MSETFSTTPTTHKVNRAQDLDDLFELVGSYGRHQKKLLILVFMPISFFVGFTMNLLLFQMVVPDHWCNTPGREETSFSVAEWHNLTIPRSSDSGKLSSCLMYEMSWISDADSTNYSFSNNTKECSHGWEFDTTQFTSTVATSLGWVCERDHYSDLSLSISLVGNTVGTLLLPFIADKYVGRRPMFYVALAIHIVFTIPLLWVTNATVHMGLRFLQGLCFETNYLMPYVIYMEVIPPQQRDMGVMLSFAAWTFGMCFSALVAWLAPHWQHLAIISIIPSLLGFLYWRQLPESPRWLLAKGKVQKCADVLLKISEANGVSHVSRVELQAQLRWVAQRQPVDQPVTAILQYPKLTIRTLMLTLISFLHFATYGVTMLSMSLFSNNFLAHFVLSIFELPSNITGCLITHYLGRRFMAYSNSLLLAVCCFVAPFCIHSEWLLMTVVGFAKLFSTSALYVVFVMVSEVLPTPVRTAGTGFIVVFGMLGMVAAPQVLHYGESDGTHYWIMLAMTVISMLAMIPLPETLGLQLPQTFEDAKKLDSGRPLTTWIHHWNVHKFSAPKEPSNDVVKEDLRLNPI